MVATMPRRQTRNSLPEYHRYSDNGCPGCNGPVLDCPFAVCREDYEANQKIEAERRLAQVMEMRKTMSITEVARAMGYSRRSIFRILRRGRNEP